MSFTHDSALKDVMSQQLFLPGYSMDGLARSGKHDEGVVNGVAHEVFDFSSFAKHTRLAKAWAERAPGFAIHRDLRFSSRSELRAVFDDLALNLGWRAYRLDARSLLLDADGLMISGSGVRKPDYCSCAFDIWAKTPHEAEAARDVILARVGEALICDPMISIDWSFLSARGELHSTHMEEIADDVLYDEAYPDIEGGVASFIARYLQSPETVLVLQGPPGTGKTRLIRGMLGEIARRRNGGAQALFTADKKALESDEIFVKFLTGGCDIFVVEDADHLLQTRAKGNDNLHRFLTIADGIVRAQGRKIIFSTNLPNVGDLDEALVRPGRCFARVSTRTLSGTEARDLLSVLFIEQDHDHEEVFRFPIADARKGYSLAEVFRFVTDERGLGRFRPSGIGSTG